MVSIEKGSVSICIVGARDGEQAAQAQLMARYATPLAGFIGRGVSNHQRADIDEEAIASSALRRCFEALQEKRYPQLQDRQQLWRVLAEIARRRFIDRCKQLGATKRGGQMRRMDFAEDFDHQISRLSTRAHDSLSPAEQAELTEEWNTFLARLRPNVRAVVNMKVAGATNAEVAVQLNVVTTTVERRLQNARVHWEESHARDERLDI